jgi:hypothetical protein
MESSELPDDLADLEGRLVGRPRLEPSASFRQRLMAAVGQELQPGNALPGMRCGWQYAAAVAAFVVLWANFSMSIANNMNWRFGGNPKTVDTTALSAELRQWFPDMSEQEIHRQMLVAQVGSRLPPLLEARAIAHFEQSMKQRQASDWK